MMDWYTYPNRTLCDTLEEMRNVVKHVDHRSMPLVSGLIDELQTYANRMEAALEDWSDVRKANEHKQELKDEIKELQLEKKKAQNKVHDMEEAVNELEAQRSKMLTDMDTLKKAPNKQGK